MRISDWSSDVCSSDLVGDLDIETLGLLHLEALVDQAVQDLRRQPAANVRRVFHAGRDDGELQPHGDVEHGDNVVVHDRGRAEEILLCRRLTRSEEHTSELQSLMRISYAVFCLKKKTARKSTSE